MFRKRNIKNDNNEIQELLQTIGKHQLSQDDIIDEMAKEINMTIIQLERCKTGLNTMPLYTKFSYFELIELGANISAIKNDIADYIENPILKPLG